MSKFEDAMGDGSGAAGGGGSAVDPIWDSVFGGPLGDDEGAFEGGTFEPIPRCSYVFKVEAAEGRLVGDQQYPTAHLGIRIVKGPAGTVNRVIWDDFFLYPFARQGETPADAATRLRSQMTRIRNAFQLAQETPRGKDVESISVWARQMIDKTVTAVIRVEGGRKDEKTGREYDARNRIVWGSVARPEAPYAGEEKKYAGMTYAQRTDAEIALVDAKAAGGGGSGKKAGGSLGPAQPTAFFGGGSGS